MGLTSTQNETSTSSFGGEKEFSMHSQGDNIMSFNYLTIQTEEHQQV